MKGQAMPLPMLRSYKFLEAYQLYRYAAGCGIRIRPVSGFSARYLAIAIGEDTSSRVQGTFINQIDRLTRGQSISA